MPRQKSKTLFAHLYFHAHSFSAVSDMSTRIDALETTISELVHADLSQPPANAGLGLGAVANESNESGNQTESTIKGNDA